MIRQRLLHEIRLGLTAVQFFTRLPVPAWVGWSPQQAADSVRWLPAVGWIVGGVFGAVLWAAQGGWPVPLAVGLAMWAALWLTGAFHEDGFADCCDALGGHLPPERALAVMKDSRVGAYAVIGLIVLLGLKAAAWVELAQRGSGPALIGVAVASHALSRWAPLWVMARLDYVRPEGSGSKSQPLASQRPSAGALASAAVWALLPSLWLLGQGWAGASVVGAVLGVGLVSVGSVRWLRRRLGGYVGDTLGAVQQVAELVFLLALSHHGLGGHV